LDELYLGVLNDEVEEGVMPTLLSALFFLSLFMMMSMSNDDYMRTTDRNSNDYPSPQQPSG
jgi:hypothetical protein